MTVTNRVWDAQKTGSVTWKTEYPDQNGAQYPGPGDFLTQTSDYCIAGGFAIVTGSEAPPGDIFDPVERWSFDGTLSSSSGLAHLQMAGGSETYEDSPFSGVQAFRYDGSRETEDSNSPTTAALRNLTGSMSVQVWLRPEGGLGSFGSVWLECNQNSSGGFPTPFLCDFRDAVGRLRWGWAGIVMQTGVEGSTGEWMHVVMTRASGSSFSGRVYVNGDLAVEDDNLIAPNTNGSARIRMGRDTNNLRQWDGRTCGLTLYNRELTQAEVVALYKKGIPPEDR